MITITADYHTDLRSARAAGIKFAKQPNKTVLYTVITLHNESVTSELEESTEETTTEEITTEETIFIDTTFNEGFTDDELIGTLEHGHKGTLSQSPAIVMIVIILVVLEVATRATSLGISLLVIAYNNLYNWFYKPVASIDYFHDLSEDTLWN